MSCIVCNTTTTPDGTDFQKVTYDRVNEDEPSLSERVCKLLKIDGLYSTWKTLPACPVMCISCIQEMTAIENAEKVKKKFKKSLKTNLNAMSSDGSIMTNQRKRSSQDSSGDKFKVSTTEYNLKVEI